MVIKRWIGCKEKNYKIKRKSKGDSHMETMIKNCNTNVFEFTTSKENFKNVLNKLEKPSLTKKYLDECKKIANLYKKPSKTK